MYIIVVGGGAVGYRLAKILLDEDKEVLIIEQDDARSAKLTEELGSIVYRGDGCEAATLDCVGTGRADMLVAVTDGDEDNLVACQVAKHKFNVPRTIARINNPENETIFKMLGIDTTVSSTSVILASIEPELPAHPLITILKLKSGSVEVVGVKVPRDSEMVGRKIKSISLPEGSAILLVISKDNEANMPTEEMVLQAEDEVMVVTNAENEGAIRAAFIGK